MRASHPASRYLLIVNSCLLYLIHLPFLYNWLFTITTIRSIIKVFLLPMLGGIASVGLTKYVVI